MYNLFISHSWNHNDAYDRLVDLLNAKSYFTFKNYSVPKSDPIQNANSDLQLRQAIYNQMRPVSCVLIMAGVYSSYSKWINIEIELAQQMGKPIIAIEPWASTNTSAVVKNAADRVVGWNTDSIVNAIRELS